MASTCLRPFSMKETDSVWAGLGFPIYRESNPFIVNIRSRPEEPWPSQFSLLSSYFYSIEELELTNCLGRCAAHAAYFLGGCIKDKLLVMVEFLIINHRATTFMGKSANLMMKPHLDGNVPLKSSHLPGWSAGLPPPIAGCLFPSDNGHTLRPGNVRARTAA